MVYPRSANSPRSLYLSGDDAGREEEWLNANIYHFVGATEGVSAVQGVVVESICFPLAHLSFGLAANR